MEESKEKLFWSADDVARELDVSKPTAYRLMAESGCLAPLARRKRVRVDAFLAYLTPKSNGGGDHE